MFEVIAVGAGGALGAVCRYGAGVLSKVIVPAAVFPVATLSVNVIGSFLIGLAAAYFGRQEAMGSAVQLFVMTGCMGGFTTFSSFSLETMNLIGEGKMGMVSANIAASVGLCLLGVWLGKSAGNSIF